MPLQGQHETAVFTYVCKKTRKCAKSGRSLAKGRPLHNTYKVCPPHMRRAFARAGIEDFRLHDLRHTSATRTLRATGNLKLVQKLLNHSALSVTEKYAHADLTDLRAAMEATAADDAARRKNQSERKPRSKGKAKGSENAYGTSFGSLFGTLRGVRD